MNGGTPVCLDIAPTLRHVDALAYVNEQRYWVQNDGNVLCAEIDQFQGCERMRLATVRRTGLPMIEELGNLRGLALADTAGLFEPIHVCFFPNNLVGVVYNFYGPRPSRISAYLRRVAPGVCPSFELEPLIRRDVLDQLRRLQWLKVMELQARTSYAEQLALADRDLGSAFEAAGRFGESEVVQLILRPEPHQRRRLHARVRQAVMELAQRGDLRENALKFVVEGYDEETERIEAIDILKGHLVSVKKIVCLDGRTRALDDSAAYRAIDEAYNEMRADLEMAASVVVA